MHIEPVLTSHYNTKTTTAPVAVPRYDREGGEPMTCQISEPQREARRSAPPAPRTKAALFGDTGIAGETVAKIYGPHRLQSLARLTQLHPTLITSENIDRCLHEVRDVEVIFCTWGMPKLTEAHLDQLPNLQAVFYAAGSVRGFAKPLLQRGITVVSGWVANAVPVAEFTHAQILLANKGYFQNGREFTAPARYKTAFRGQGNFGATVALLGAGQIGRKVIELLRPFRLRVIVFDPFMTEAQADNLGVEKVSLEQAFFEGQVVSNHLADVPATRNLLNAGLFASLPPDATFINTGRGGTVVTEDLIEVLRTRPDLTALLDVTEPEPLRCNSPLWSLPNARLSSHIAGAIGAEVGRVAEIVIDEFQAWEDGRPLRYAVSEAMLETMA